MNEPQIITIYELWCRNLKDQWMVGHDFKTPEQAQDHIQTIRYGRGTYHWSVVKVEIKTTRETVLQITTPKKRKAL